MASLWIRPDRVKPALFKYHRPESVVEVLALLAVHGEEAKVLAGGQSLVPLMNMRLVRPAHLIDINRVTELAYVRSEQVGLRVGALARWVDVEVSPEVAAGWSVVPRAIRSVGHPQIRNRGTLCGSAAHADPAAELPALLVALGAELVLVSSRGHRRVPAPDFFLGVFTTQLAADELLVEIVIPQPARGARQGFAEFARRPGDFALAGAVCSGDRLVAFGAGGRPQPLPLPDGAGDVDLRAAVSALDIAGDIHGGAQWRRGLILEMALRAHREAT